MPKYRLKADKDAVVHAVQWDGNSLPAREEWVQEALQCNHAEQGAIYHDGKTLRVHTMQGHRFVPVNGYIVRASEKDLFIVTAAKFDEAYKECES